MVITFVYVIALETWQAITKAQIPPLPQSNGMGPVAYPIIINNI